MNVLPVLLKDGYKADHRPQYPDNTQYIYSNLTPRSSRVSYADYVVVFGMQYFIKEFLLGQFNELFFWQPRQKVMNKYKKRLDGYLGPDAVDINHIGDLHDLGYLPLHVKSLSEGTLCPIGVPSMTVVNTLPEFFWLTNQLETLLSTELWPLYTSATTAHAFRKNFDKTAEETGIDPGFVKYMGHDFSMRGMFGHHAAMMSGAAHLTSFAGTDTIPAIDWIEEYYGDGLPEGYQIGSSIPATEHSVMCAGGMEDELGTYRRLINKVYPKGPLAIVSDTWDFWGIVTDGVRALKDDILVRDGKVVFRPDSGDPADVICGDINAPEGSPEHMGAMSCLWNVFGGTTNAKGYMQLNPKVGLIYGDSINIDRQQRIAERLMSKGFVPDVVLGNGSYMYQYVTRDTFGFAIKATNAVVNGVSRQMFKSPKGDSSKKSAKGLLRVDYDPFLGRLVLKDQCTPLEEHGGLLNTVFLDGLFMDRYSVNIQDIRYALHGENF